MHWYEGSIAEAVNLSKQRNAIFVVFVEGDNELSVEMASTIDDGDVLKRLSDAENFLAIKLKSGSSSYTHFAQIYQFVPVPSLFFIGRNGTPLEVVCAGVEPDNLANRIDRILEEHHKEKPNPCPSTSGDNKQQTVNFLQTEGAANAKTAAKHDAQPETSTGPPAKVPKQHIKEVTASGKQYDVVCDGEVCVRVRKDDAGPSGAPATAGQQAKTTPLCSAVLTGSTSSMEEKMEKAKELIEARKREKAAKEKEAEKQKELERRAQGQGVAELKKWQADQELKQIQEERKREKLENNLARQRILEQIAQDRAERRARDLPPPAAQPQVSRPAPTSGDVSSRARIQFKLPDGSSHTAHFDAGDTLAEVHTYVSDNLQLSTSRFALWTAFPRHELTDPSATLRQLQLTPSAALLVLPRREHAAVTPPSTFATIITVISQLFTSLILEPSQQFYNWIYARLYPNTPGERPRNDPPAPPRGGTTPPNAGTTPPRGGITPPVRRRGNIHRLGEERSGEDDNNTWNGNSTQQM